LKYERPGFGPVFFLGNGRITGRLLFSPDLRMRSLKAGRGAENSRNSNEIEAPSSGALKRPLTLVHFMRRQARKFSAESTPVAMGSRLPHLPMQMTGAFISGVTMPTYEYICEKCDHQFDVFQSIKDKPLTICPRDKCRLKKWGKGKVKKMIGSGAGIIFKGSGFYITDYRSDSYKEAAKKDAAPSGEGSKSSEGKSKTESAAKTESKPKETKTPKSEKS
jgi:putative FmdB family regulatory protein